MVSHFEPLQYTANLFNQAEEQWFGLSQVWLFSETWNKDIGPAFVLFCCALALLYCWYWATYNVRFSRQPLPQAEQCPALSQVWPLDNTEGDITLE